MKKGTKEGTAEEKNLVRRINKGEFNKFIKKNFPQQNNIYCVHVTRHKFSKLTKEITKPKSDAFLVDFHKDIKSLLINNNYYLNDKIIDEEMQNSELTFKIIDNSGISIKDPNSSSYTIHKFTPKSFLKVFKDRYLGAGAVIYSKKEKDYTNNKSIIEKFWKINEEDFFSHFYKLLNNIDENSADREKFASISDYCLSEIKRIILENENIKNSIFTGKKDFEEPFGATYSFIKNNLNKFEYSDFYVSQGSSRKKNPTIIIKPK